MGLNTRQSNVAAREAASERRSRLAQLRRSGVRHYRDLAAELGVSVGTIAGDMKIIQAEWRESARALIDQEKGLDLERAEDVIKGLWDKATSGNPRAAEVLLQWVRFRADVVGYAAPKTVRIDIEQDIRVWAEEAGIDPEEAVLEARRVLAEGRR